MKLFLLLLTIGASTAKETVPVFIMDHGKAMSYRSIEPDPLNKVATNKFLMIAKEAMQKAECVIIFLEDHLSTEDITTKDKQGTPYSNLQLELLKKNVKYLPAVDHPYKTLTRFFKPMPFNVFHLSPGAQLNFKDNSFKYIYVIFRDINPNETRTESLRKHDTMIKEVYSEVKNSKSVVAIYTGKVNPVVVEKLTYVPARPKQAPETKSVFVVSEGALFRFAGVQASTSQRRRSNYNLMPMVSSETFFRRKLSTTMTYAEFDLQFNFGFGEADWTLDTVILLEGGEEVGRRLMQVGAPWNWSYTCGEPLCIVNERDGSVITVSQYQIQPIYPNIQRRSLTLNGEDEFILISSRLRGSREPYIINKHKRNSNGDIYQDKYRRNQQFGQTINCGPYFSISILSGLFVVYTCLGVLGFGILMLFSCGSNDRFDDPHGKEVFSSHGEEKRDEEFGQIVNCCPYSSIGILSGLFVVYTCLGVLGYGILMLFSCGSNDRFDDPHGKEVFSSHGEAK